MSIAAIARLQRYQLPLKVEPGLDYLQGIVERIKWLSLYKDCFPLDWAQSKASWISTNAPYSPREEEFLVLVGERLFPLEVESEFEERFSYIPLSLMDLDWWERDISDFEPLYQFLLSLYGVGYVPENWQEPFGFTPQYVLPLDCLDWERLKQLCQEASRPLCHLYDLLSIIDHSTGCIFLDATWEDCPDLEWNKNNLDLLHSHWLVAQNLWEKEAEFTAWLASTPTGHAQVVELFNLCSSSL